MAGQDAKRQLRVLLAHYTGSKHVVECFEVLYMQLGYYVDIKLLGAIGDQYDLIVHMGLGPDEAKLEGLEHVQELRKQFPKTPMLVVSGHNPSYALEEVKRYGADDFLRKNDSGDTTEFVRRIEALLQNKPAPSK